MAVYMRKTITNSQIQRHPENLSWKKPT